MFLDRFVGILCKYDLFASVGAPYASTFCTQNIVCRHVKQKMRQRDNQFPSDLLKSSRNSLVEHKRKLSVNERVCASALLISIAGIQFMSQLHIHEHSTRMHFIVQLTENKQRQHN